jgi:antitoxin component YwqK of YwqJK toxin-antitoxin module
MKKILITLSALALFITVNAQEKKTEYWANGNKKSEGVVLGTAAVNANASKAELARQSASITKDGKWSTWNENGTVRSEEYYSNGSMTGSWKVWYDDGKLESDINFTAGTVSHFYKNGNKHSQGGIKDGMVSTGKWTGYYENGNKNYEGSYNNDGQKDGTWTWYDEKGKVTTTQVYSNGTLVK